VSVWDVWLGRKSENALCKSGHEEEFMAKYGKAASKSVESAVRRTKKGTLKSGSGRKVRSRKQAIAIGLSEARAKGAKVPPRKSARKSSRKTTRKTTRKTGTKKK
jgi:hypothetical protein